MNVGIVGGGAAGLAAAYEFVRNGSQVTVFERAPFLGGQASTFGVAGAQLERGYHHLFTSDRDMIWLIEELGLGHKLAWIPSRAGLYHNNRIWPFTTPVDLLRFSSISLFDRFRLGLTSLYLQRIRDWRRFEGITAAAWLKKRVGTRAYYAVWEPLLRGKFGQHYDEVGMVWFWGKMALRFASRGRGMVREMLGYPMGSFGEIFDTLGERIRTMGGQVRTGVGVRRVIVESDRAVGIEIDLPGGGSEALQFDTVLATVPSSIFPRLAPSIPEDYSKQLTGVSYLAAVLMILVLDRPLTGMYWLNIADREIPFVGVVEQTNLLSPDHYQGKHIVYLANYLGKDNPLYHMGHSELLQAYRPHLRKLNPLFDESWVEESFYHREEAAQPVIGINYGDRIPRHRTPIKDLYLANTTQIYPEDRGTNYSVRLGRKVAQIMLEDKSLPVRDELPLATISNSVTSALDWD